MAWFRFLLLSVFMSLFLACSSDDDSSNEETSNLNEISDEPFSGTIDGEAYAPEYIFGYLIDEGNEDIEKLEFFLSDLEFDCSTAIDEIRYDITGEVFTNQIGFQITTISTQANGTTSNQSGGLVELVSINAQEAVIKIKTSGSTFALEGKFTVTICP